MMATENNHIPFTKMEGAGNDFVVIDNRSLSLTKQELIDLAPQVCDRKFGVGADGIMALLSPEKEDVDYTMFYRNPDGSDAGMCGNGARCMALFARSLDFPSHQHFNVHDQVYEAKVEDEETVRVAFPMEASAQPLTVDGKQLYAIHTGTEHIVTSIDKSQLDDEDFLREVGRTLRNHKQFHPKGTNVNFICGIDESTLQLQTYERGVEDLTLACGTGAIASALVWHTMQDVDHAADKFKVHTKGGTLNVYFSFNPTTKTYSNINLEGPAHFVFEGQYLL